MDAPRWCHRLLPLLCAAALLHPLATSAAALSAAQSALLAQIANSLRTQGPRATLQQYFDCTRSDGYELIQTGDSAAMALAVTMLTVSDACVTETLHGSIAMALQTRPAVVLQFIAAKKLEPSQANCIPTLIEAPREQVQAALKRTEDALNTVTETSLQSAKVACLQQVADYRQSMARGEALDQERQRLDAAVDSLMQHSNLGFRLRLAQNRWQQWMQQECLMQQFAGNGPFGGCQLRMIRERLATIEALQTTVTGRHGAGPPH